MKKCTYICGINKNFNCCRECKEKNNCGSLCSFGLLKSEYECEDENKGE